MPIKGINCALIIVIRNFYSDILYFIIIRTRDCETIDENINIPVRWREWSTTIFRDRFVKIYFQFFIPFIQCSAFVFIAPLDVSDYKQDCEDFAVCSN